MTAARSLRETLGSVRARLRAEPLLAIPVAGGGFWLVERLRGYPASYIFVPDPSILVVQAATWAALLAGAVAVSAVLCGACVLLVRGATAERAEPSRARTAALLAAITALGVWLRFFWRDLVPPAPWVDGIYAIEAAVRAGRFLGLSGSGTLYPPDERASTVLLYGGYLDAVRVVLLAVKDRIAAHFLLSAIPGALLPPALFLAARRFARARTALASALLASITLWPLVLSRWAWFQQAMSLLLLLAFERTAAGLEKGRLGPLALGGLLAGAACQTYLGGILGALGLFAWVAAESLAARRPKRALAFLAGALVFVLPTLLIYRAHPLGGRAAALRPRGGPLQLAGELLGNAYQYAGQFFFTGDITSRHGFVNVPHQSFALVALMTVGLVALLGVRPRTAAGRGFAVLFLATLMGGILSNRYTAPNGLRTGFAGLLALVPAGEGFVRAVTFPGWSSAFRRLAPPLLALALLASNLASLVRWALSPRTSEGFGEAGALCGRFAAIAGPSRVVLDPLLFSEANPSYHVASFQIHPERTFAPPAALRVDGFAPGEVARAAPSGWYLTMRDPGALRAFSFEPPGYPNARLHAIRVSRARAPAPAPKPAPPAAPAR